MKASIIKLISAYESKIIACDEKLAQIKTDTSVARQSQDADVMSELKADRRECSAKRQSYVQAIADFKSVIGEI